MGSAIHTGEDVTACTGTCCNTGVCFSIRRIAVTGGAAAFRILVGYQLVGLGLGDRAGGNQGGKSAGDIAGDGAAGYCRLDGVGNNLLGILRVMGIGSRLGEEQFQVERSTHEVGAGLAATPVLVADIRIVVSDDDRWGSGCQSRSQYDEGVFEVDPLGVECGRRQRAAVAIGTDGGLDGSDSAVGSCSYRSE